MFCVAVVKNFTHLSRNLAIIALPPDVVHCAITLHRNAQQPIFPFYIHTIKLNNQTKTRGTPPRNADAQQALPSIRKRVAAMLYESLLLLGVLSVTFMVPHLILGLTLGITAPGYLLWAHVAIVLGVYFIWYWSHGGQTLAMQTWKLKLTTPDGTPPALKFLVIRYLLTWPSVLFYGAGLIWALFDRDRQFLHDRLAGTRIVFTSTGQPR